ncbi:hypothetical protein GobsT_23650 [Gemmata obscuriglobus]|nr:hypothetical protein GobsT_23650 [Gemmata obscuriglobus]VTS04735.1 unnamed protein product [Gemmata obscuriglobus UQM 2246]
MAFRRFPFARAVGRLIRTLGIVPPHFSLAALPEVRVEPCGANNTGYGPSGEKSHARVKTAIRFALKTLCATTVERHRDSSLLSLVPSFDGSAAKFVGSDHPANRQLVTSLDTSGCPLIDPSTPRRCLTGHRYHTIPEPRNHSAGSRLPHVEGTDHRRERVAHSTDGTAPNERMPDCISPMALLKDGTAPALTHEPGNTAAFLTSRDRQGAVLRIPLPGGRGSSRPRHRRWVHVSASKSDSVAIFEQSRELPG